MKKPITILFILIGISLFLYSIFFSKKILNENPIATPAPEANSSK